MKKLIGWIILRFFPNFAENLESEIKEDNLVNSIGIKKGSFEFECMKDVDLDSIYKNMHN